MSKRKPKTSTFTLAPSKLPSRGRRSRVEDASGCLHGDEHHGQWPGYVSRIVELGHHPSQLDHSTQPDTIDFSLKGTAPFTISPTAPLPIISHPVIIDGTSQPGYSGTRSFRSMGQRTAWRGTA